MMEKEINSPLTVDNRGSVSQKLFLCFVNRLGKDIDGMYTYSFLFSNEEQIDIVWGNDWNFKPAGICGDITPEEGTYEVIKKLKTDILFNVAQECMCFSMQDAINQVVALAYESLDDPDKEYPEEGIMVFHFGDALDDVEAKLSVRGLKFER